MKLTVLTTNKSISVNLNDLLNRDQMNTEGLSNIAIMKRTKLQNIVEKKIKTLD